MWAVTNIVLSELVPSTLAIVFPNVSTLQSNLSEVKSIIVHGPNLLMGGVHMFNNKLMPPIKKVIFQKLHTIVIWEDGEKTVVKCSEEEFDKEKGLAMAIAKRLMDRNKFKRLIKVLLK